MFSPPSDNTKEIYVPNKEKKNQVLKSCKEKTIQSTEITKEWKFKTNKPKTPNPPIKRVYKIAERADFSEEDKVEEEIKINQNEAFPKRTTHFWVKKFQHNTNQIISSKNLIVEKPIMTQS
jgi:hypothetical protein